MSIEDKAQERELFEWEMRNRQRPTTQTQFAPGEPGYGPAECVDCEIEMPALRRTYGFKRCVECAEAAERQQRR